MQSGLELTSSPWLGRKQANRIRRNDGAEVLSRTTQTTFELTISLHASCVSWYRLPCSPCEHSRLDSRRTQMPSHTKPACTDTHTHAQTGTASSSEQRASTEEQSQLDEALKRSVEDVGERWTERNAIAARLIQERYGFEYVLVEIRKHGNCLYEAVALCNDSGHTWHSLKEVHYLVTVSQLKFVASPTHIR